MRISDWSSDVCSSDLEIFADEQQFRPRIAKDEADFGGRETAVDRCETGPRTRRPEKERIPAVMVFGQRRNAVTRRDVRSGQRVRDTVRPRVELSEARLAIPELHRGRPAPHLCLRRRNVRPRPDGLQMDHFALPTVVST